MLLPVLLRQSLQVMIALPDQEEKCFYHSAMENQTVTFVYRVVDNINTRNGRMTSPMTYLPDVVLTAYDADGEEYRYFQIEAAGEFGFRPRKSGEVRICLKSQHPRQKLFNFAFDVEFKDNTTQKL